MAPKRTGAERGLRPASTDPPSYDANLVALRTERVEEFKKTPAESFDLKSN